jgi:hypothetical protein
MNTTIKNLLLFSIALLLFYWQFHMLFLQKEKYDKQAISGKQRIVIPLQQIKNYLDE